VALLFSGVATVVYGPALHGPLVSDDLLVLVNRPWLEDLNPRNVLVILDPRGEPVLATANWAPVHLLVHLVQGELFGSVAQNTYPYHLTNVIVHGINATLLAALLAAGGVPLAAALLGGLVFLLHPANVEAVAWVFQLKTLLSFTFSFAALLCLMRRPALSTLFFGLSILAKPSAASVLAAAIVLEWVRQPGEGDPPRRTRWLFVWGGLLALYGVVEFGAFRSAGEFLDSAPLSERGLQVVAIVGRYLMMTTASYGLSAFHQPERPASLLDPWVLLGLVTLLAMAFVCVLALLRRRPAAAWLGLAVASYAPVAQIFAFRYPMADRYLYFVIAGFLGALLVTFSPQLERAIAALRARRFAAAPGALLGAGLALTITAGYGAHAHARAAVWRAEAALDRDAIAHYPNGIAGQLARARRAAALGQADEAIDAIEALVRLGSDNPMAYLTDADFQALRGHPRYEALLREITRKWIDYWKQLPDKAPGFGAVDAVLYYIVLEEFDEADALIDELEQMPGVVDPAMLRHLRESVRRERAARDAAAR
jgi:hypothetical protein